MFNQLAADLKAGHLSAAQQDFTALQKDLQTLQSGNLSTAQPAYAALQQDFSQHAQVNAPPAQSSTSSVSLNT